ncbi:peptidoglycan editing factor PgeF [Bacillus sp. RG28]|uniref:Purine nucleoside phosphorylase n=1 Tax=Gottfriedia endophytica TaxID=2820819 RepID=A0A940NI98_9BACI|nr:peptidoglycan editing factor PgeF [Gottfriedia endophytica]MBP0724825.1 peptidoglycan editing factor PgeF [Gottfriedia endophytica]
MTDCFVQTSDLTFVIQPWINSFENLVAGFTTNNNGVSQGYFSSLNVGLHVNDSQADVVKNRELVAETVGFPLQNWVCSEQIHSNKVEKVEVNDLGKGTIDYESCIKGTDGIYTTEKGVLLTSFYADCVPLFFICPEPGLVGLAHAGWKGTTLNIGSELITEWVENEKAKLDSIQVVIGPSIGNCCYEVDEHVYKKINEAFNSSIPKNVVTKKENGRFQLDLKEANRQLLINRGIKESNIKVTTYCTSCHPNLFFSHRRDNGQTGRMMSFIGWRK